jgi:CTP:molybdopterin cytidylyltransferase MocA
MIPAVILAAGMSTRMGRTKATLPLSGGETFVTRLVRTFLDAGVDEVVVVVGHDAEHVVRTLEQARLTPRIVLNPAYASGQFSSLLAGLAAIDRPGVQGMLMTLVDVPAVAPQTVRAVLDRFRKKKPVVVRPVDGVRHGHPILLDRSLFTAIRAADAQTGLKPIVRMHASADGDVQVDDEGAFVDVDTPEEYDRLVRASQR